MYILCSFIPPRDVAIPDFFFFVCVCMQKSVVRIVVLNPCWLSLYGQKVWNVQINFLLLVFHRRMSVIDKIK